ncbi:uncharacterized protein LOC109818981 isoform X2 [Cajanus cajan]|uniref:uncharacterized protein LOC109818981 isoform X2 n=1 Tax=Cajanus cajan TaxID=3821 RepID=UPI0010FB61D7|nr:uncharacterized protein LOC109818981 isoform X2 [Cajanus cajan]
MILIQVLTLKILGKMNIAAWASKEEVDKDAFTSLKTKAEPPKSVIEARVVTWEEAEKAKYIWPGELKPWIKYYLPLRLITDRVKSQRRKGKNGLRRRCFRLLLILTITILLICTRLMTVGLKIPHDVSQDYTILVVLGNKIAMVSCYFNPIRTSSHLISADLSRKFKIPKLLHRKKRFDGSPRSSKITAFYGLKTPPYELVVKMTIAT